MQRFVSAIASATASEIEQRLEAVRRARRYYTYDGVMEQLEKFISDPFGAGNGSYINCYGELAARHHVLAVPGPQVHAQLDLLASG